MANICRRACIRQKRKVAQLFSRFQTSYVRLASRRVIWGFATLELLVYMTAWALYHGSPDIALLAWFPFLRYNVLFLMFAVLGGLIAGLGSYGVFGRKVRMTRYYLMSRPFSILLTILLLSPLWYCTCRCGRYNDPEYGGFGGYDYIQCNIVASFVEAGFSNEALRPNDPKLIKRPARSKLQDVAAGEVSVATSRRLVDISNGNEHNRSSIRTRNSTADKLRRGSKGRRRRQERRMGEMCPHFLDDGVLVRHPRSNVTSLVLGNQRYKVTNCSTCARDYLCDKSKIMINDDCVSEFYKYGGTTDHLATKCNCQPCGEKVGDGYLGLDIEYDDCEPLASDNECKKYPDHLSPWKQEVSVEGDTQLVSALFVPAESVAMFQVERRYLALNVCVGHQVDPTCPVEEAEVEFFIKSDDTPGEEEIVLREVIVKKGEPCRHLEVNIQGVRRLQLETLNTGLNLPPSCHFAVWADPMVTTRPARGNRRGGRTRFDTRRKAPTPAPKVNAQMVDPQSLSAKEPPPKWIPLIHKSFQKHCVCDGNVGGPESPERTSCLTSYDADSGYSDWCHLRKEPVTSGACSGISVYEDASQRNGDTKRFWSEDVCTKECKCSKRGMKPDVDADESKLKNANGERVAFGSSCQKWRKSDEREWCFVGYDTSCPDRYLYNPDLRADAPPMFGQGDVLEDMSQWISYIPCQQDIKQQVRFFCLALVWLVSFSLLSVMLLNLPMICVIVVFVRNRCGDPISVESQFAVEFSSDEDASSDDWEVSDDSPRRSVGRSSVSVKKKRKRRQTRSDRTFANSVCGGSLELAETQHGSRPTDAASPTAQPRSWPGNWLAGEEESSTAKADNAGEAEAAEGSRGGFGWWGR